MSRILLSHGAGGRDMLNLIEQVFRRHYSSPDIGQDDNAVFNLASGNLAFTTDAFVVSPLFFPAAISAGWQLQELSMICSPPGPNQWPWQPPLS